MKKLEKQLTAIFEDGAKPHRSKDHPEHPEDRAMRLKGVADGEAQEAAVLRDYGPLLAKLVTVYADKASTDALELLRETFWTNTPPRLP
jgi:hypothetical protein